MTHRLAGRAAPATVPIVLALVSVALLAACSVPQTPTLGESDSGTTVAVGIGEKVAVSLPSNATTGFRWTVADPGPLKQIGEVVYDAPGTPGAVGAGGTETFRFDASARGAGALRLEYRRPWEKSVPAEKTWSVSVTVK